MRSSISSSPIPPLLRCSFFNPRYLCHESAISDKPIISDSPISENPIPGPATKSPNELTPPSSSAEKPAYELHLHQNPSLGSIDLTHAHLMNTLLSHRNDPFSALRYFNWAERRRGFVRSVDSFCILLHILMGSVETRGQAQNLLRRSVFGDSGPSPIVFVDRLFDCGKRFNFELDSQIFNLLLNSYIRANRIRDAVHCFNKMVEIEILPSVPFMNILLTALIRRNMSLEAQDLHEMVEGLGVRGNSETDSSTWAPVGRKTRGMNRSRGTREQQSLQGTLGAQ